MLSNIPERHRGWFYLFLSVLIAGMLLTMFIVEVLNDGDLQSWLPIVLAALGLSGNVLASGNTDRTKHESTELPPALHGSDSNLQEDTEGGTDGPYVRD